MVFFWCLSTTLMVISVVDGVVLCVVMGVFLVCGGCSEFCVAVACCL